MVMRILVRHTVSALTRVIKIISHCFVHPVRTTPSNVFSLDGKYLSTIFLPGAFVCRAVIDEGNIYSGVCWSRLRYLNQTPNSGFVTILDKKDKVVSNPGGTQPAYKDGSLQLMVQDKPTFYHCHDVCIDNDKNIYVCQWNANKTYPVKLERV